MVVYIDGGNDWLNMMPPTAAPTARSTRRRPTLAFPAPSCRRSASGPGLNADFTGMSLLSDRGRVAWIPGIGMNNPNLSHFVSTDLWGQGSAAAGRDRLAGALRRRRLRAGRRRAARDHRHHDLPVMLRGQGRSFVSITGSSGFVYPAGCAAAGSAPRGTPPLLRPASTPR